MDHHTSHGWPREGGVDHTLALLREGYRFIGNRCERYGTDVFETRLMLKRVVCMRGPEAAELFYAGDRFTRRGGLPPLMLRLLQDLGSVQQLDGAAHRHRKGLFQAMTGPTAARIMAAHFELEWKRRLEAWQKADRVVLFDEARSMLTRAATAWAGLRLDDEENRRRTRELSEMVEATGSFGPRKAAALVLRARCERWARRVIRDVRSGALPVPEDAVTADIASYRDTERKPLTDEAAAVELLNILRPTVAVARYVVFAARALHQHPDARRRIVDGDERYLWAFAEEVRRTTPFFPFVGGRARRAVEWRGNGLAPGAWVMLDLYGTNHDPRVWPDPGAFLPERFLRRRPSPFEHIPQGAGETAETHRCPGEPITLELIKSAARLLAGGMTYEVPRQDLSVDLSRMPALPKSGFVMTAIRPTPATAGRRHAAAS